MPPTTNVWPDTLEWRVGELHAACHSLNGLGGQLIGTTQEVAVNPHGNHRAAVSSPSLRHARRHARHGEDGDMEVSERS